jgi:hypothetical protein
MQTSRQQTNTVPQTDAETLRWLSNTHKLHRAIRVHTKGRQTDPEGELYKYNDMNREELNTSIEQTENEALTQFLQDRNNTKDGGDLPTHKYDLTVPRTNAESLAYQAELLRDRLSRTPEGLPTRGPRVERVWR